MATRRKQAFATAAATIFASILGACSGGQSSSGGGGAGRPGGAAFTDAGADGSFPPAPADAALADGGADGTLADAGSDVTFPPTAADSSVDQDASDAAADAPNPCGANNGGCPANSTCTVDGGVVCVCNPGYTRIGSTCTSVDYQSWSAPSDDPLETQYVVSADGAVVTDQVTRLIWQRQVVANPCPGDGGGACSFGDAAAYCASLDALPGGGLGGSQGWRVPSVVELLSIASYAAGSPAIDTADFPATPPVVFWTATADAADASQGWAVDFSTGLNATQATATPSAVRCVTSEAPTRAPACGAASETCCYGASCGPDLACSATSNVCATDVNFTQTTIPADAPPESGYTVSPGGSVVKDAVTGLVWQRRLVASPCGASADGGAGSCTWIGARDYCASLDAIALGGYASGWRLPSITELVSIASYSATPAIDPAPFANPPSGAFWSSTASPSASGDAWTMSYVDGTTSLQSTGATFGVRCVSSGAGTPAPEGCGALGQACCYGDSCGAPLFCSGGSCVTDRNYVLGTVPPDSPPASQYAPGAGGATASDSATGLLWVTFPPGSNPCPADGQGVCTWADAAAYCASLDASGYGGRSTGWRLPSVVELLGIVNYTAPSGGPMVDTTVFPGVTASAYWTATAAADGSANAWELTFANGTSTLAATSAALGVECVN